MALDKGIKYGKEKRKEYYKKAPRIDMSCRNHGSCPFCTGNRKYKNVKKEKEMLDKMKEWEYN